MSKDRRGRSHGGVRRTGPTGRVVAAYVSGNALPAGHLAALIATVQAAVDALRRPAASVESTGRTTRTRRQVIDHAGWGGIDPVGRH